MHPFRQNTPKHRKNRKVYKYYKSYKKTLSIDFNNRCGYCNDYYHDHKRYFVIDHFVPQNPDGWSHSIPSNKYDNLIYACAFCNGAKSNKWPTKNENKSNDGTQGFIKPTLKLYTKVFRRDKDGSIIVYKKHLVGSYIHRELNFGLPIHSLNWKIEKFLEQEKVLENLYNKKNDIVLKQQLNEIKLLRLSFVDKINELFNAE
jgi:5-methylcytosine-specific restriction endonuclease McrA